MIQSRCLNWTLVVLGALFACCSVAAVIELYWFVDESARRFILTEHLSVAGFLFLLASWMGIGGIRNLRAAKGTMSSREKVPKDPIPRRIAFWNLIALGASGLVSIVLYLVGIDLYRWCYYGFVFFFALIPVTLTLQLVVWVHSKLHQGD